MHIQENLESQKNDEIFMQRALYLADRAEEQDEIPVGAVLVINGEIVAEGWNQSISLNDPSAHAEMMALRAAGEKLSNYRLVDTTLYVTLEPCPMCAGLLVHARVSRLVFGAFDYKTGACGSVMDLVRDPKLNHQLNVTSGILAEQCGAKLSAFFKKRREVKRALKKQNSRSDSD